MKFRIGVWTGMGALVVILWTLYVSATSSNPIGIVRTLEVLTCPVALAGRYALSIYLVLLVNAVTYALIGMIVETMRGHSAQTA